MAQGGVAEHLGFGGAQQSVALAPRAPGGSMDIGVVCVGPFGHCRRHSTTLVSRLLSLFDEAGICPDPVGGPRRPGPGFFYRRHAVGAGVADNGQRSLASAPPAWRAELLVGSARQILLGQPVLGVNPNAGVTISLRPCLMVRSRHELGRICFSQSAVGRDAQVGHPARSGLAPGLRGDAAATLARGIGTPPNRASAKACRWIRRSKRASCPTFTNKWSKWAQNPTTSPPC